jgi:uncharacterized protein
MRTGSFEAPQTVSDRILGRGSFPNIFDLMQGGRDDFSATVEVWNNYDDQELSFTAATLITLCDCHDSNGIFSFDSDFDGLVTRYNPTKYR